MKKCGITTNTHEQAAVHRICYWILDTSVALKKKSAAPETSTVESQNPNLLKLPKTTCSKERENDSRHHAKTVKRRASIPTSFQEQKCNIVFVQKKSKYNKNNSNVCTPIFSELSEIFETSHT